MTRDGGPHAALLRQKGAAADVCFIHFTLPDHQRFVLGVRLRPGCAAATQTLEFSQPLIDQSYASLRRQNYLVDRTGWAIQTDLEIENEYPGCSD